MLKGFARLALVIVLGMAGSPSLSTGQALAQSACGASVTVRPGDTLNRIAARCGLSVGQILRANPRITNPNNIQVGQTIRLVTGGGPVSEPDSPPASIETYRVRRGDTMASIARRFAVPLGRLIAANRDINPNRLRPGMVIRIPGRGGAPVETVLTLTGTLTDEGVECQAMRGDDGRLYTLVGDLAYPPAGTRVQVRGARVASSICQQGRTLEVSRLREIGGSEDPSEIRVTGVLTDEGVECPAMRAGNGKLYTLTGDTEGFGPGDLVEVRGRVADFSPCQQGTTIAVDRIRSPF